MAFWSSDVYQANGMDPVRPEKWPFFDLKTPFYAAQGGIFTLKLLNRRSSQICEPYEENIMEDALEADFEIKTAKKCDFWLQNH